MFATILHANDGSEPAFKALLRAIELAEQNKSSLHMALVEEVPSMPDFIEEIRGQPPPPAADRGRFFAVPLPGLVAARASPLQQRLDVLGKTRPIGGTKF